MDEIYSIVALRMPVFFSLSNNVFPYNRVCYKEDLVNSSNLQSIFFKVLKRVYRSSSRYSLDLDVSSFGFE